MGKGGKNVDEIDFNNPDLFKQIINNSANKKKSKQNIYDKVIAYVTLNVKKIAIVAVYLVLSGIIGNIVFIINNPIVGLIIILGILLIVLVLKFKKRKQNGSGEK